MANGRHSFVAFYPSDWMAGTARLPRLHRSVLFDVCCYIWDHAKPVPASELALMLADLPNAAEIVQQLVAVGKLERHDDGSISNAKALHEAEKAYGAWQRMSEGGSKARSNGDGKGDGKDHSKGSRENQNQNQNQSSPNGEHPPYPPFENLTPSALIFATWNHMVSSSEGLPTAKALTPKRKAALAARLKEHDTATIVEAIRRIPESDFLMGKNERGWTANFDWLLQPSSMTKLIEGAYHGQRGGKQSGWLNVIRR